MILPSRHFIFSPVLTSFLILSGPGAVSTETGHHGSGSDLFDVSAEERQVQTSRMVLGPLKWVRRTRLVHTRGCEAAVLFKWAWVRPGPQTGPMDGSGLSDFSIERILGPQLGPSRAGPQNRARPAPDPRAPPLLLLSFPQPCFRFFSCACSSSGIHLHLHEAPGTRAGPDRTPESGSACPSSTF